jgi:hypothetical protein
LQIDYPFHDSPSEYIKVGPPQPLQQHIQEQAEQQQLKQQQQQPYI